MVSIGLEFIFANIQKDLRMKKFHILILSMLLLGTLSCTNDPITIQEATRILTFLSSDELKGRKIFTPEIDLAADFIANEMKSAGLSTFDGLTSYVQPITMYHSGEQSSYQMTINGESWGSDKTIILSKHESVNWTTAPKSLFHFREQENFRGFWQEFNKYPEDAIIIVHPAHAQSFEGLRRRLMRPIPFMEKNIGPTKVAILYGGKVTAATFQFQNPLVTKSLSNVIGVIPGKRSDELVVVSAHYDHIGQIKPVDGDSIANGADDNGSGTTAMLLLAKYYAQQAQPERTMVFVAFTAEEAGGYGATYLSQILPAEKIVAMVNIEMVGKVSKYGKGQPYITGFERSSFGEILQSATKGKTYGFHPDPYPEQNLFFRSDNATFARKGVPAHTISTSQISQDKFYHTVNDEFETLDMENLIEAVKAIAVGIQPIIIGSETPTRVIIE